ncbi:hypothetical protein [Streptomyces bluensis]|uniref:hypothetical protein n=1 Tax=Streptomyces bluensis TaxID=33897 RepID=UPI0036C605FD
MPGHPTASRSAPTRPRPAERPAPDTAGDLIRWASFSCALVPVVLLGYGTSLTGAAGAALGLAAVTAVCRLLLRQSERGAARASAERGAPRRGRHGRVGPGTHRGGRHSGGNAPVD